MLRWIKAIKWHLETPAKAKAEWRRDRRGLNTEDPGIDCTVAEAVRWLGRAQDNSMSQDGGVARDYNLLKGCWNVSYPETTGYIVPTLLDYACRTGLAGPRDRARRMLDWLVSIQMRDGSFQAGLINQNPIVPAVFNTGQILIGLAAGVQEFGDERYHTSMCRAADWLVSVQDRDGCWRKYPSPFAKPGERTYDTHVAWGLFEAARIETDRSYGEAGMMNVRWALSYQRDNGWFDACCLTDSTQPLTHTIGYALRGLLEAYRYSQDITLLEAGRRTANGLMAAQGVDGFLPGRLDASWRGTVPWTCLTGNVQIAACWFLLDGWTGDRRYGSAASAANHYVRRTIVLDGPAEIRGAVKGCFPADGGYGMYKYLNWACKFFIDAQLMEQNYPAGRDSVKLKAD